MFILADTSVARHHFRLEITQPAVANTKKYGAALQSGM
jgi:hypothetical protein